MNPARVIPRDATCGLSRKRKGVRGISLVIPTFNRGWYLEKSLNSLSHTKAPKDLFEILVIDDGSCDQTELMVATFENRLPVRYLRIRAGGATRNCSVARNVGVIEARFPVVATTDPEILFTADVVSILLERFRRRRKSYVTAGGFIKLDRKRTLELASELAERQGFISEKQVVGEYDSLQMKGEGRFADLMAAFVPGSCDRKEWRWLFDQYDGFPQRVHPHDPHVLLAVWRDDLLAVGGYDERFRVWGSEDTDLLRRLETNMSLKRNYDSALKGVHLWHTEEGGLGGAGDEPEARASARSARVFLTQRQRVAAYRSRNGKARISPFVAGDIPQASVALASQDDTITPTLYASCLAEAGGDEWDDRVNELFGGHCAVADRLAWRGRPQAAMETYRYALMRPWERSPRTMAKGIAIAWRVTSKRLVQELLREPELFDRYTLALHATISLARLEGEQGNRDTGLRLIDAIPSQIERPYRVDWCRASLLRRHGDEEWAEELLWKAQKESGGWSLDRQRIELELSALLIRRGKRARAKSLAAGCARRLDRFLSPRFDSSTCEYLAHPVVEALMAVDEPEEAWRVIRPIATRSSRSFGIVKRAIEIGCVVSDEEGVVSLLSEACRRFPERSAMASLASAMESFQEARGDTICRKLAASLTERGGSPFVRAWLEMNESHKARKEFVTTLDGIPPEVVVHSLVMLNDDHLLGALHEDETVIRAAMETRELPQVLRYVEALIRIGHTDDASKFLLQPSIRDAAAETKLGRIEVRFTLGLLRCSHLGEAIKYLKRLHAKQCVYGANDCAGALAVTRLLQKEGALDMAASYLSSPKVISVGLMTDANVNAMARAIADILGPGKTDTFLKRAFRQKGVIPQAIALRAVTAQATGKRRVAQRFWREALQADRDRNGVVALLPLLIKWKGVETVALVATTEGIPEEDPLWSLLNYARSVLAEQAGDRLGASRFRRLVAEAPVTERTLPYIVSALYHLGVACLNRRDKKEARHYFTKVIALRPDHRKARASLDKLEKSS